MVCMTPLAEDCCFLIFLRRPWQALRAGHRPVGPQKVRRSRGGVGCMYIWRRPESLRVVRCSVRLYSVIRLQAFNFDVKGQKFRSVEPRRRLSMVRSMFLSRLRGQINVQEMGGSALLSALTWLGKDQHSRRTISVRQEQAIRWALEKGVSVELGAPHQMAGPHLKLPHWSRAAFSPCRRWGVVIVPGLRQVGLAANKKRGAKSSRRGRTACTVALRHISKQGS